MRQIILTCRAILKEVALKEKLFDYLTTVVTLDIVLTFIMVVYFNAIELNPIYIYCNNFYIFFIIKCIISILFLSMIWSLSKKYWVTKHTWLCSVYFLILWYNYIVLKNLYEILGFFSYNA